MKVDFETSDNVSIVGNYWPSDSDRAVILVHMMPATKESWTPFADLLSRNNFAILSFDLRGHGESVIQEDKKLDFKLFMDDDHKKSLLDIDAAVNFVDKKEIFIIGASIGANLALWYQSLHPEIKKIVLLSPGINYRGIDSLKIAKNISDKQQVFIASGDFDGSSPFTNTIMSQSIASLLPHVYHKKINSSAHGSNLLIENIQLMQEIIDWLNH